MGNLELPRIHPHGRNFIKCFPLLFVRRSHNFGASLTLCSYLGKISDKGLKKIKISKVKIQYLRLNFYVNLEVGFIFKNLFMYLLTFSNKGFLVLYFN